MTDITVGYLNIEREKAWKRIESIEEKLEVYSQNAQEALNLAKSKISVDEASAKAALINASAYAETAKSKSEEITTLLAQINPIIEEYKTNKTLLTNAIKKATEIEEKHSTLIDNAASISSEQVKIQALQGQMSNALINAQNVDIQIKAIESSSVTNFNKINDMLSKSTELKTEISDLYDEVFGYETESGEHEEGLKDKLDKTYNILNENMTKLATAFVQLKTEKTTELNEIISEATNKHNAIVAEIKSHLPDGVAAGLAGAFHDKKETETKVMADAYSKFDKLLKWMVGVALLPFAVYIYWLYTGKTVDETIKAIPNMTLAVIPLYAPLIWLGIHLNKKINLSKKLIEEYAYKEAISKTVTGVSEQIKTLKDEENSQEIYTNLLRLIISASADNPGKYITEYNKCDNPFVEILSDPKKFEKLLDKTPGMLDACLSFLKSKKDSSKDRETERTTSN